MPMERQQTNACRKQFHRGGAYKHGSKRSASKKCAVQIPQPQMVANYNKYMEESISLIGFLVIIGHVYEVRSGGGAFFPIF